MIVPKKRELMMWRELSRRLGDERMLTAGEDSPAGIVRSITTKQGPVLALTSWGELLSLLKVEASNDPDATSNLRQLRALCDAADNEAFMPIYANEATNQHIPMLILQLGILIEDSVKKARDEGVLDTTGNRTGMSWDTIGRWAKFSSNQVVRAEAWFGIHFSLWKKHGGTPLWLSFTASSYGRAPEVSRYIKPWAKRNGIITAIHNKNCFAVAVNITVGKERDKVVDDIVDLFKRVAEELSSLEPRTAGTATSSSVDSPVMDEQGESQYGTNSDPLTVLE
jgi:hypothetical protein